jgi:hypothetical protein
MKTFIIEDKQRIESIILHCDACFVGITDLEGNPYVVPMNFGYENGIIYLHSGPEGSKLEMLEHNNNVCITFSVGHKLAAFRTRMKIYDAILITEVHRNYVGITFQISNAYKTGIAMENNGFDSLFIFNNDSFHNGCLAYHRGHGVHEAFLLPDFLAYSVVNLLFY